MYKSIFKRGIDKFEEKKSLFIGYSAPVLSEEEALSFIDEIKEKHKDATHNCSAYVIGENMLVQRFDDDGEPSGMAGIPILEVMKREGLTDLVVVVTRYFGGTLLGAGGLIRAYSKGSKLAIESGIIVDMKTYLELSFLYDYVFHGKIINFIESNSYKLLNTIYTEKVELTCLISMEKVESFKNQLIEITSDEVKFIKEEESIQPEKEGKLLIG